MKAIFTSLFFTSLLTSAMAQDASLQGLVKEPNGIAVATATVSLLKASDSSWVHTELSDEQGKFSMKSVSAGNYLLDVTAVGYEHVKQAVTLSAGGNDVTLSLAKKSTMLNEVTVQAKKPFIEVGLGKTVINMESATTTAGNNLLELLRKLPGVSVDMNNNISLQGKQGVLVLVNGRETYMSADQLAEYLKGMTADEVAQLELITQPPAKYDASGTAGIINIKTKKLKKDGFNGNAEATYGQAIYGYADANARLNYGTKKLNVYANPGAMAATGWVKVDRQRDFKDEQTGAVTAHSSSLMESKENFSNEKLQVGADYNASAKTTIGASVNGVYHPNSQVTWDTTVIADYANNSAVYNKATTYNKFLRTYGIANAYVKHEFDKESSLDVNLDFVDYRMHTFQSTTNTGYDQQNVAQQGLELKGDLLFVMDAYSAKADYTKAIGKVKLEAGLKGSLVKIDNAAGYELLQQGAWIADTTRSNRFGYTENVNAAYVSASRELGPKWQAQAGLRTEQTNLEGKQTAGSREFQRSYLSFFPTAYVSYAADSNNKLELNYGRRIERPSYQSLNPFIYFVSQYNYNVGNPELRPQYTSNVELKHSYKNKLVTTASCARTTDVINSVVLPDAKTNGTYKTDKNVSMQDIANISVSFSDYFYQWFLLSVSGNAYYTRFKGHLLDEDIETEGGGAYVTIDTQFTYKSWSGEVYYYVTTPSRQDFSGRAGTQQYMSIGVSKKLLHDTATLKLSFNDPFKMYHYHEYLDVGNTTANNNYQQQMQQVALSFSYNFGKKASESRRNMSPTDEMRRMGVN